MIRTPTRQPLDAPLSRGDVQGPRRRGHLAHGCEGRGRTKGGGPQHDPCKEAASEGKGLPSGEPREGGQRVPRHASGSS